MSSALCSMEIITICHLQKRKKDDEEDVIQELYQQNASDGH
jgi:hypothetical protein